MRLPRISFVGGLYHATCRCNNREFSFKDDDDFATLLKTIEISRERYNVKVHAFCLTNNHYHLVVSTPEDDNLSLFFQYVNGQYARKYNKKYGRTGHFWGERFFSTVIEQENQLLNTFLYAELNMTRNSSQPHPKDWKWSSYSNHASGKGIFNIDYHPLYLELGNTAKERQQKYKEIMEDAIEKKGLLQKQVEISQGGILGTQEFVTKVLNICANYHEYYKQKEPYITDKENIYILRRINKKNI